LGDLVGHDRGVKRGRSNMKSRSEGAVTRIEEMEFVEGELMRRVEVGKHRIIT
jgi:hypothetical protein